MRKKHIKGQMLLKVTAYLFLTCVLVAVVYPFMYSFFGSFKGMSEILTSGKMLPEKFNFDSYVKAWKTANFSVYTWNSVWYSGMVVIAALITSTMGGYVFGRADFKGIKVIFAIFTSLMFITLGTSSMYPRIQILKFLGLNDTLWGLVVMQFFGVHITNIFLVRGFVNSLPRALDEAAEIDGCNFIQTFLFVILPLLKPIIATIGIFAFTNSWNDYLMPMVVTLSNPAQRPLSVGLIALKSSAEAATAWNLILAGAMISAIPMVLVFLFFSKFFIKGLVSGAVKG